MRLIEMRAKYEDLVKETRTLAEKDSLTPEEQTGLDAKFAEMDELRSKIEKMERLEVADEFANRASAPVKPEAGAVKVGANRAAQKPYTEGTRGLGEFLLDVRASLTDSVARERLESRAITGLGVSVPSDGGFLVSTDHSTMLMEKAYEQSEIVNLCTKISIGPNSDSVEIPTINETSRADGSRQGGIQMYWKSEGAQFTSSKPNYGEVKLEPQDLTGLCYVTNKLLADASALGSYIVPMFGKEMAFKLNDGIINGSGNGQPLGIISAACTVSQDAEGGQDADTVVHENIVKMWSRCYGPCRKSAVWLINQDVEPSLYTMGLAVGTGGGPSYLPANGLSGSPYATLMGRPVMAMEQCDTVGDNGDIILADFSQYLIADKGPVENASSMHLRFDYNETAFRFYYRFDGKPWWASALTPKNSTITLSPFVTLAARA